MQILKYIGTACNTVYLPISSFSPGFFTLLQSFSERNTDSLSLSFIFVSFFKLSAAKFISLLLFQLFFHTGRIHFPLYKQLYLISFHSKDFNAKLFTQCSQRLVFCLPQLKHLSNTFYIHSCCPTFTE